jgi:hypothetical protein
MSKINGTYKFNTVVTSQMIVTVSYVRKNESSSILEFSIKIWLLSGDRIIQSIPVQTIEYEGRIVEGIPTNDRRIWGLTNLKLTPIIIVLSDRNILICHEWIEGDENWEYDDWPDGLKFESAVIFLEINGAKIINKGHKLRTEKNPLGWPDYPILAGRINNETGFLVFPEQSTILSIAGGVLEFTTTVLNTPLANLYRYNTDHIASSRLSANTIIVFYAHSPDLMQVRVHAQLVQISETNNFTVSSAVQFVVDERVDIFLGSSRISDNECFLAYHVLTSPTDDTMRRFGMVVTVNGNSIAWGSGVNLINIGKNNGELNSLDFLPFRVLRFPSSNNFIVFSRRRRTINNIRTVELLAQSVLIQDSVISPQNSITVAKITEGNQGLYVDPPSFRDFAISPNTILMVLSTTEKPLYFKIIRTVNGNISISDEKKLEQDELLFQVLMGEFWGQLLAQSHFTDTVLIPSLNL